MREKPEVRKNIHDPVRVSARSYSNAVQTFTVCPPLFAALYYQREINRLARPPIVLLRPLLAFFDENWIGGLEGVSARRQSQI